MKIQPCLVGIVLLLSACEATRSPGYTTRRIRRVQHTTQQRPSVASPGVAATTASRQTTGAPHTALPPPDAELIYQRQENDAFGSSTYTTRTQVRGPVVEEIHIGNQRVDPYGGVYPPTSVNGVVQPGYVPAGTTMVYDPVTGRSIPVRRR
jgi:hypothetical protein